MKRNAKGKIDIFYLPPPYSEFKKDGSLPEQIPCPYIVENLPFKGEITEVRAVKEYLQNGLEKRDGVLYMWPFGLQDI